MHTAEAKGLVGRGAHIGWASCGVLLAAPLVLLPAGAAAHAASVVGTVTIDGKPARFAVVYLEAGRAAPTTPQPRAVMDQRNLSFVPTVLPVVLGTVIEFTNSDDVQHNVFTTSGREKFDLGTYSRGDSRTVTLSEPGEIVILCNLHMEMEARILVLAEPTFAAARPDGSFEVSGVPPGSYRVRVWWKKWLAHTETLTVPETDTVRLDVRVPD